LLLFLLLLACFTLTLFNIVVPCLFDIDIIQNYCFSCCSLFARHYSILLPLPFVVLYLMLLFFLQH
jgi:hypothetical protein